MDENGTVFMRLPYATVFQGKYLRLQPYFSTIICATLPGATSDGATTREDENVIICARDEKKTP